MDVTATPALKAPLLIPLIPSSKDKKFKHPMASEIPLPTFTLPALPPGVALISPESSPRDLTIPTPSSAPGTSNVTVNSSICVGSAGCSGTSDTQNYSAAASGLPRNRPVELAREALALTSTPLPSTTQTLSPRGASNKKPASPPSIPQISSGSGLRLNKFVRRLHDMLQAEKDSGIVEWRRGLLVLHSTDAFAKTILPKYFNTRNFKTFRRQLNYYGFVHVRSFSTTGSTTTALWVNRDLAKLGSADIASVLMLKRVEPCEAAKTAEGRRVRKEMAIFTVEEDIGVSPKTLQMEQIRSLAMRAGEDFTSTTSTDPMLFPPVVDVRRCSATSASIQSSQQQQQSFLSTLPLPSTCLSPSSMHKKSRNDGDFMKPNFANISASNPTALGLVGAFAAAAASTASVSANTFVSAAPTSTAKSTQSTAATTSTATSTAVAAATSTAAYTSANAAATTAVASAKNVSTTAASATITGTNSGNSTPKLLDSDTDSTSAANLLLLLSKGIDAPISASI